MPYISSERMKEIRSELKKEFPLKDGWKLSVTKEHYSSVRVVVLAAPIKMTDSENGRESVNHFYIEDRYREKPEVRDVLKKIYSIINHGNRIVSEDGDYGSIPQFYVNIQIGAFEKPFVMTRK